MIENRIASFLRMWLAGLAGVLLSFFAFGPAYALAPTFTYRSVDTLSRGVQGYSTAVAAANATCVQWLTSEAPGLLVLYVAPIGGASGSFACRYPEPGNIGFTIDFPFSLYADAACTSGYAAIGYGLDKLCQPQFCLDNINKFAKYSKTITTAPGVSCPSTPATICSAGCELLKVSSDLTVGVTLGGGGSQVCYLSGSGKFTGVECPYAEGEATGFAITTPQTQAPIGAGSGNGATPGSGGGGSGSGTPEGGATAENQLAAQTLLEQLVVSTLVDVNGNAFDCDSPAEFTGDPARVLEVESARLMYCALEDSAAAGSITRGQAEGALAELTGNTPAHWLDPITQRVDVTNAMQSVRWLTPTGCLTIPTFALYGHTYTVDMAPLCNYSTVVAAFLIISASLVAYRILASG